MADYQSGRTGANIDQVLDNADAGNIGKVATTQSSDVNSFNEVGFFSTATGAANQPFVGNCSIISTKGGDTNKALQIGALTDNTALQKIAFRVKQTSFGDWQELYHTGNTGAATFDRAQPTAGEEVIVISNGGNARLDIGRQGVDFKPVATFWNANGQVGAISTGGTSTTYATTSDNDLKNVIGKPTDEQINQKFNDIFDCFTLFDWKNGGNDQPVWGFLAWDVIDKGLDFASEREGGKQNRALKIGDVYETIQATYDDEGNELTPEVNKTVTPAGVDQSKVVPYLVAKIEQLERRLSALEGANG